MTLLGKNSYSCGQIFDHIFAAKVTIWESVRYKAYGWWCLVSFSWDWIIGQFQPFRGDNLFKLFSFQVQFSDEDITEITHASGEFLNWIKTICDLCTKRVSNLQMGTHAWRYGRTYTRTHTHTHRHTRTTLNDVLLLAAVLAIYLGAQCSREVDRRWRGPNIVFQLVLPIIVLAIL